MSLSESGGVPPVTGKTVRLAPGESPPALLWFAIAFSVGVFGPLIILFLGLPNDLMIGQFLLFDQLPEVVALLMLGIIALGAGYYLGGLRKYERIPGQDMSTISLFVVWALVFFLTLVTISILGGGNIARTIHALVSKIKGLVASTAAIYLLLFILAALASAIAMRAFDDKDSDPWQRFLLAGISVFATAALCFACGSRTRAIIPLLAPVLYIQVRKKISFAYLLPFTPAVMAIVELGDAVRRQAQVGSSAFHHHSPFVTFVSQFAIVDYMSAVVRMNANKNIDWLGSLTTLLRWQLPSSWVGVKAPIGALLAREFFFADSLGGITLGVFGEYYYYFGIAGLLLLSIGSGWTLRYWASIAKYSDVRGYIAFFAVVLFSFITIRDGVFTDIFGFLFLLFALAIAPWFQRAWLFLFGNTPIA